MSKSRKECIEMGNGDTKGGYRRTEDLQKEGGVQRSLIQVGS